MRFRLASPLRVFLCVSGMIDLLFLLVNNSCWVDSFICGSTQLRSLSPFLVKLTYNFWKYIRTFKMVSLLIFFHLEYYYTSFSLLAYFTTHSFIANIQSWKWEVHFKFIIIDTCSLYKVRHPYTGRANARWLFHSIIINYLLVLSNTLITLSARYKIIIELH